MLKTRQPKFLSIFIPLFILGFVILPSAFAAFTMTATPSDGGFDLRFPRVNASDFKQSKEVVLRINSDIGKQYRVAQNVIQPLSSVDGTELPDDQFKMYALPSSNSAGTLIFREETPVNAFDAILYTSNGAGDSDSFKLVYTIAPKDNQILGSYYGRISYILTPLDSTLSQVVVSLNIYVDMAAGEQPVIEVTTNTGSRRLAFSSKGMRPGNEAFFKGNPLVSIKVRGDIGATYRLYQAFEGGSVISDSGEDFDLTKIQFAVSGGGKGVLTPEGDLKPAKQEQLLYVSDIAGSSDEFVISYEPADDFRLNKTGFYRGRLNFVMEKEGLSGRTSQAAGTLDVEIEVVPLFEMYVYSDGCEGVNLKFGEASFKTGPKTSDVDVYVESNMGKPYQVSQKVASLMMNESGDKVPAGDFTSQVRDIDSKEEPKFYVMDTVPVKEGESVLFSSGHDGESARLKIRYVLTMRPDTKGGNYSTQISYSLSMN